MNSTFFLDGGGSTLLRALYQVTVFFQNPGGEGLHKILSAPGFPNLSGRSPFFLPHPVPLFYSSLNPQSPLTPWCSSAFFIRFYPQARARTGFCFALPCSLWYDRKPPYIMVYHLSFLLCGDLYQLCSSSLLCFLETHTSSLLSTKPASCKWKPWRSHLFSLK